LPSGDQWTYEIKWDGIRALAYVAPGFLRVVTRNGIDVTRRYPELQNLESALDPGELPVVLDGEIVAMDEAGVPDFSRLQRRMNLTSDPDIARRADEIPAYYAIFDLLVHRGDRVLGLEYGARRARLAALGLHGRHWSVPRSFVDGERLLEDAVNRGMEGVVAKVISGTYAPGQRTTSWIKAKVRPRQEFVIGGWTEGAGARAGTFGSLLVGARHSVEDSALHYFGNVGSGFSDEQLRDFRAQFDQLARDTTPFDGAGIDRRLHGVHWIEPCLIAEIEYQQLTGEGRLRQPVFRGLRFDKDAREVVFEGRWVAGRPRTPVTAGSGREG
jgi:bifunctional non-homologous end joining protein LigD